MSAAARFLRNDFRPSCVYEHIIYRSIFQISCCIYITLWFRVSASQSETLANNTTESFVQNTKIPFHFVPMWIFDKTTFLPCSSWTFQIGMPQDTYNIWSPFNYPFTQKICILQGVLSETSTNATVLTITSFTIERYIAICHPFRFVLL